MKLTPFEPGTLRLAGKNRQIRVDHPGGFTMKMLPLPRWREVLYWHVARRAHKVASAVFPKMIAPPSMTQGEAARLTGSACASRGYNWGKDR